MSQHVALVRPVSVEPDWLAYSLTSRRAQQQLLAGQYGGTKQQLGLDDIRGLNIHLPSRVEQRVSLRRLADERGRFSRMTDLLRCQIVLLKERRQALITAAVTGELTMA